VDDFDVAVRDTECVGEERADGLIGLARFGWGADLDFQAVAQRSHNLVTPAAWNNLESDSDGRYLTLFVLKD